MRQLQPSGVGSWWQPGHPGWAIYPVDSEQFISTGALDSVNVQHDQIVPGGPSPQQAQGKHGCAQNRHSLISSHSCPSPMWFEKLFGVAGNALQISFLLTLIFGVIQAVKHGHVAHSNVEALLPYCNEVVVPLYCFPVQLMLIQL